VFIGAFPHHEGEYIAFQVNYHGAGTAQLQHLEPEAQQEVYMRYFIAAVGLAFTLAFGQAAVA
jgi:hypothetical protein